MTTGLGGDEPRTPGERWRAVAPGWRAVLVLVALVAGLNVLLAGVERVLGGDEPGGAPSSSYATAPDGAAAYADLLARHGHPVQRLRSALDEADLHPAGTVVVLDVPELANAEAEALGRFVRDGGRLVVAGQQGAPLLRRLLGEGPVWSPGGAERATPVVPASEVRGVGAVRTGGEGSWRTVGTALPVLATPPDGDGGGGQRGESGEIGEQPALVVVANVGRGRVVALADPSVLQNRLLDEEDNAAFGVASAGAPGRPVSFAEASHGYADGEGLAALPSRWRWGAAVALVAALVWMWSRAKRFGPPEEVTRALPPPRRAYVDALAASVARTADRDGGVQPLRDAVRRRLAQRASLPHDVGDADLVHVAGRLGADPADMARLLAPVGDDEDLLGAGRAAAWALGKGT